MKIAYIVPEFPSLSQTFILSQITGLLDGGHKVDIYAARAGAGTVRHPDVERYHLLARTRYRQEFAKVYGRRRRITRGAAILARAVLRHPARVRRWLGLLRRKGVFRALDLLFAVAPFWRTDYDIIVTHFGPTGNAWLCLKEWTRAKYVCAFYGYDITSYVRQHGPSVYRELFRQGDLLLVLSRHMAGQLEALGCDPARIVVHPLGIDVGRFAPRSPSADSSRPLRVLSVARLVEKKGLADAIEAVARVIRQGVAVEYTIVGSGPLEQALRTLIRERGLEDQVTLDGPQTSDRVAAMLTQTDVFLLPSVTAANGDQEGTPTVLLEAQACGIPVLSTQHSGIPEIVADGRSGYLVPEHDVEALAERLRFLAEHPDVRHQLGAFGRASVTDGYDIRRLCSRLTEIFEALARSGRVSAACSAANGALAAEPAVRPDISVIIATRNRAGMLREALGHLAAQETGHAVTYDVVVVDNGSSDETRDVVAHFKARYPVPLRYVYEGTAGKPWALNAGLRSASGKILAFVDDDITPVPTWLRAVWSCFKEEGADGVAGRVLPVWADGRPAWLTDYVVDHIGQMGCLDHGNVRLSNLQGHSCRWVGGNMAFRREAAQRVGDYDIRFSEGRGDDTEYYERFVRHGLKVVYEPSAVAYHNIHGQRMTPAHFRRMRHVNGHALAYWMPWSKSELLTVMPLAWYWDTLRYAAAWVKTWMGQRPWQERFRFELKLRERGSTWLHRLRLLPQGWRTVLVGQSYLTGGR